MTTTEKMIRVRRNTKQDPIAEIRLADLEDVQPFRSAHRGWVQCDRVVEGALPHPEAVQGCPHRLRVMIYSADNSSGAHLAAWLEMSDRVLAAWKAEQPEWLQEILDNPEKHRGFGPTPRATSD